MTNSDGPGFGDLEFVGGHPTDDTALT